MTHKGADSSDYIRIYDLSGNRVHENWVARGDILSFDCSGKMLVHKDEGAIGANLTIADVGGSASPILDGRGGAFGIGLDAKKPLLTANFERPLSTPASDDRAIVTGS